MGPITLYDKSFLEGLNLDESVMFDAYFYAVTCPVFYVETLANLAKEKRGRSPEELVGAIANKFPQMHGAPNVHHKTLAVKNICGGHVPMTGQIALAGGIPVNTHGKNNVVFKESPEAISFSRWQAGEFENIEREFAQDWRQDLASLDLSALAERARKYGKDLSACKQIEDCRNVALELIDELPTDLQLALACELLNMSVDDRGAAKGAWEAAGKMPLREFAPYTHFVISIQVFFDIALATGKISSDRPSNFNDMAYLYYLPFCHVFVSSDRLHRTCAPLFMRNGQQFVWGEDLKADLRRHNEMLLGLPEEVRDQGLIRMSPKPMDGSLIEATTKRAIEASRSQNSPFARSGRQDTQTTCEGAISDELRGAVKQQVKDFHASREYLRDPDGEMRNPIAGPTPPALSKAESETLQGHIQKIVDAADTAEGHIEFDPREADSVTLQRMVQKKRGSWFQVPKSIRG